METTDTCIRSLHRCIKLFLTPKSPDYPLHSHLSPVSYTHLGADVIAELESNGEYLVELDDITIVLEEGDVLFETEDVYKRQELTKYI